jgi:hypothetical protein
MERFGLVVADRLFDGNAFEQVSHWPFGRGERVVEVVRVDDRFERGTCDGVGEEPGIEPLLHQLGVVHRVQQEIDFPPVDTTRTRRRLRLRLAC